MTGTGAVTERYELVIGLEVHVQLSTRTKLFCRCSTAFGAAPNAHTCPVCLGMPGALPVPNPEAVLLATRAALALGCEVQERSVFARKNYFYPDLPKGYQISQFELPLALRGRVTLASGASVGITRIHMEEDAGKSVHDKVPGKTAIDLNRAGVPLAEIVSEPDLRSGADAVAYLKWLRESLVFAGVSECSMEEGSLRVDANVSARLRGETAFRTRTEIKNLNSFAFAERAIALEFKRHCAMHDRGEPVVQQTMLYDQANDEVRPARSKEESHDYRYFPDPDLPPIDLTAAFIAAVRASMPESPTARRMRYTNTLGVPAPDADALTTDRALAEYFEAVVRAGADGRTAANWTLGEVQARRNEHPGAAVPVPAANLAALIALVAAGTVSNTAGKQVFATMWREGGVPKAIAERDGLIQVGDADALARWVDEVFAAHPDELARLKAGERKLVGVLVGQVMKRSGGKADPKKVNQMISERAGLG